MLALKMALKSIGSNKLRAFLTMLGIIFGVINAIIGTLMTIAGIAMGIEEESQITS